ncbi:MAG TPA: glycosyltransferase family 2 protein [Solirubrobacterales bacterium]|nr:glycosyltransferase family 2 protein [Solirubrobacterales bacterium]
MRPSVSVLIVAWNSSAELRRTLPPLVAELREGDELIVVDNDSPDDSAAAARELAPAAQIVKMGRNRGFAGGANVGASAATGDLLVILNPDAMPLPGWGEAIRRPWLEGRGWSAWQGLVAGADGTTINSAGNPVHFTGVVWAGMHDEPLAAAPGPSAVTAGSGACLAVPLEVWHRLGGFAERFFMYHEDVDLSLRLLLAGETVGIEPRAVVAHDYEFTASAQNKWRWLERNRLATLVRVYPGALVALLAPALLATEAALLLASMAGGWGGQKLRADAEAVAWLPRLLRERREIQRARRVSAGEFAAALTADLDSPFIPEVARSTPARLALRTYWRLVRALLGR